VTYLVDTDIVISFLNGRAETLSLMRNLQPDGLSLSVVTYGEVIEGIIYGREPISRRERFEHFLMGVDLVELPIGVMERFAQIRGELRSKGQVIPDMDLLIAATAVEFGLILVTRNRRHFDRVPGLQLYEGP
jgi:tRNA(fMet)-specific endonuclease VapC